MAFHSGDLHMHELTGFDRGRDGRRGKRHEIQIRTHAFVFQNADPLVHKRHRAPSVTVAAMRPLLRWERLYHCCSWQAQMPTVRTQTDHERARGAHARQGQDKMQHAKKRQRGRRLARHAKRRRAKHVPVAYPLPARDRRAMRFTAPNPPRSARGAAEGLAARSPTARWRAWPPNPPPWPGRPQAW